jgi:hypothetical protein
MSRGLFSAAPEPASDSWGVDINATACHRERNWHLPYRWEEALAGTGRKSPDAIGKRLLATGSLGHYPSNGRAFQVAIESIATSHGRHLSRS